MLTVPGNLLLSEMLHGLVALPFAYSIYKKTKSFKYALAMMLATYLIDLDHLIDYFSFYGISFNLFKFLNVEYFALKGTSYVIFHAWEWVGLFGFLAYLRRSWKSVYTIIAFALLPHLIVDSLTLSSFLYYSIIFRIFSAFTLF